MSFRFRSGLDSGDGGSVAAGGWAAIAVSAGARDDGRPGDRTEPDVPEDGGTAIAVSRGIGTMVDVSRADGSVVDGSLADGFTAVVRFASPADGLTAGVLAAGAPAGGASAVMGRFWTRSRVGGFGGVEGWTALDWLRPPVWVHRSSPSDGAVSTGAISNSRVRLSVRPTSRPRSRPQA
ncbi:MAG: hypothetical protein ABIY46_14790, partial [Gemmatimonadales bacterium]